MTQDRPALAPSHSVPDFTSDILRRFEEIWITELIDGEGCRYQWHDGRLRMGSKDRWIDPSPWLCLEAAKQNPWIDTFCRRYEHAVVYAEAYGWPRVDGEDAWIGSKRQRYGAAKGHVRLAVFDILMGDHWLNPNESRQAGYDMQWVPTVAVRQFTPEVFRFAEGPTLVPGATNSREGVVIQPVTGRVDPQIGRVIMKVRSGSYSVER